MANPQTENGHTKIANELMEAFCKLKLSPNESQIVWCVLRKTYGWHKTEDSISLTQFQEATKLSRANVCRAIKKLVSKQLLLVAKQLPANSYKLQKDWEKWVSSSYSASSSHLATTLVAKQRLALVAKQRHTKESIKETIQKKLVSKDTKENPIEYGNPQINSCIKFWEEKLGATKITKQDRYALKRLLTSKVVEAWFPTITDEVERIYKLISIVQNMSVDNYTTRISSPFELDQKLNKVKDYLIKKKGEYGRQVTKLV